MSNRQQYPSGISECEAKRMVNETDMRIFKRSDTTNRPVQKVWLCLGCNQYVPIGLKCFICESKVAIVNLQEEPPKNEQLQLVGLVFIGIAILVTGFVLFVALGNWIISWF